MVTNINQYDIKHFLVKSSDLTRSKLFVEFYQPKYRALLDELHRGSYPLRSLNQLSIRLFDGPFGSNRKVDMYQESGIPYIRVKDVLPSGIKLDELTYISEEKHKELSRSRVVPGNVLITIAGRIGTAAVFPNSLKEGNITGHIVGVEIPDSINPYYLAAFINSQFGEFQVMRLGHRTTRPELNLYEIGQILVSIPPRSIQNQIAKVMQDAYAERREKLEDIQGLLTDVDEIVMSQIGLSSVILPDKKQFVVNSKKILGGRFDLGLYNTQYMGIVSELKSEFNENLKTIASISYSVTSGATPLGSTYLREGVPFLRVQNVNAEGVVDFNGCLFVSEEFAKTINRSALQDGDVLLVIVGATIGKCAVVRSINSLTVINQALARIRIRESAAIIPDFLQAFLSSQAGQIQITALKRPVAQGNLSLTETGQILVPVIPLEVQQEIAQEMERRRFHAKYLRAESETSITVAKARVERMILGEEYAA